MAEWFQITNSKSESFCLRCWIDEVTERVIQEKDSLKCWNIIHWQCQRFMSACFETVNIIMKSRMRESRTYGSVRGLHCEVWVYSTVGLGVQKNIQKIAHLWGVLRIVTKTLQNGSRQLRTDRNLLRNSTDRPKNKACVTGSDSFRKRTNRTLSRSRERNPKTGTDNHNIENQHCRVFFWISV